MSIKKEIVEEYIKSFKQALVIFIILFIGFWPVRIEGISMEPSLCDKDRVIMSRALGLIGGYERGMLVICKNKEEIGPKNIVKRIIAVPGDALEIKEGKVYINGEVLNEDYILGDTSKDMAIDLLENQYFVMGDNRQQSVDSRYFGAIDKKSLKGKIILRWFPIKKLKIY